MGEALTLTGMVLASSPIKEYDKRIEMLTRERGRISAFAHGAKRPGSPLSACASPFVFGKFELYEGRNSYDLKSAAIGNYFEEISKNYEMFCYASYFAEVLRYFSRENVRADGELLLLYVSFRALEAGRARPRLIKRVFELRLLAMQGEGIELFSCLRCGRKDARDVYFSKGGLMCSGCAAKEAGLRAEEPASLGDGAKRALQYALSADLSKLYAFDVSDGLMEEIDDFMKKYLARYLPHKFKSAQLLP